MHCVSKGTPENVEDKCEDGFEQGKNTPASGQRRRQQSRRHIFRRGLGHFCALIYHSLSFFPSLLPQSHHD